MIKPHHHRLIHLNENDLQLQGANNALFKCHRGILCSAQANQTKAVIMHAGQFLGAKRKRPRLALSDSAADAFLPGVRPEKTAFMFAHAVTHTA